MNGNAVTPPTLAVRRGTEARTDHASEAGSTLMALDRPVVLSFPGAIQAVAALEDRIAMLHHDDEAWARRDAQSAVDALREAFGIRRMTEAELDAAHEAAHVELDAMIAEDAARFIATTFPDHADMSVDEVVERYQGEGR